MRLSTVILRLWMWLMAKAQPLPAWLKLPLLLACGVLTLALALILWIPFIIFGRLRYWWYRFFPPPATRDISRLAGDEFDLDAVAERVDDEGQVLNAGRKRRIYRDRRLLPKAKPPPDVWPRPRRRKVMSAEEADRLFAGTLRTRNRKIRDLLADEAQLKRLGLPLWENEEDVAQALGVSVGTVRHYSVHREAERVPHYVTFSIPKRNGDRRLIMAPKRRLKSLQRKLHELLVAHLPVSRYAHGFRKGRSIRSGAESHVGRAVVLHMDLQDFFPTVTFARVRGLLISFGYGYTVATTLAVLMTEAERQPVEVDGSVVHVPVGPRHCVQGAPTSPGICNAICRRLDYRLAGLARKYGWTYTRYADDLAFSGDSDHDLRTVRRLARQICRDEGFTINTRKTRVARQGQRQSITGVTVNQTLGLSRTERRRMRAAIHRLNHAERGSETDALRNHIRGKLAYLAMLNPAQADQLRAQLET